MSGCWQREQVRIGERLKPRQRCGLKGKRDAPCPYELFQGFCSEHRRLPQPKYRGLQPRRATTAEGDPCEGIGGQTQRPVRRQCGRAWFHHYQERPDSARTHIVDHSRIIRNVQKDKGLSRRDIPILDALANHIREELGENGGSERLRRKLITSRSGWISETRPVIISSRISLCGALCLGDVFAVRCSVYAEVVRSIALPLPLSLPLCLALSPLGRCRLGKRRMPVAYQAMGHMF